MHKKASCRLQSVAVIQVAAKSKVNVMANLTAQFNAERCKGCGLCIGYCPKHIIEFSKRLNTKGYSVPEITDGSKCTRCGFCAMMCPDFGIEIQK
jgi:2-oxoglutarate ferredoxin oxidoreductase subunit delta